jgi:hypothetical protein
MKLTVVYIVTGCIISLPFLLLFTALFVVADEAYKELLNDFDIKVDGAEIFVAIFVASVWCYVMIGTFLAFLEKLHIDQTYSNPAKGVSSIISSVFLFNLNALFLSFIAIQFIYLFGNHDKVEELGLTYSQYAVKGFWELQAVSIIALAIIYFFKRFTVARTIRAKVLVNTLAALLIVNVLIIIFSAHTRMNLYEDGYGYTELRLFTHVFMGLEAVLFLYLLATCVYRPLLRQFSLFMVISGFIFLFGLNIANPDKVIARRNIDRFEQGRKLDVNYLLSLSSDSYLQLEDVDFEDKELYYCRLWEKEQKLLKSDDSWVEFSFSKKQALDKLEEMNRNYDEQDCEVVVFDLAEP